MPLVDPVMIADLPASARTPASAVCAVVVVAMICAPDAMMIERELRRLRR